MLNTLDARALLIPSHIGVSQNEAGPNDRANVVALASLNGVDRAAQYAGALIDTFCPPAEATLPSLSENALFHRLAPSVDSANAVEAYSFDSLMQAGAGYRSATDTISVLLDAVRTLHSGGLTVAAADVLLNRLVSYLDAGDWAELDALIRALTVDLECEPALYDDHGMARLINVLSLTLRYHDALPSRRQLRDAYRQHVAKLEGSESADQSVAFL